MGEAMEATFLQSLEEWKGVTFVMQDDKVVYTRFDTKQLGYETEEIVGTPMRKIVAPECFDEVVKLHHDVLKKGGREVVYYKTLGLARDGSKVPLRCAVWATTYHDKPAVGGVMAVITDKDQAAPLPSDDSGDYRNLWAEAGKSYEGIAVFESKKGKELRCIYANGEIERLSGYSSSELMGAKLDDLLRVGDVGEKDGTPSRYETEMFHKDGHTTPVELCIGMAKLYRQKQVTVIYVRDITERKTWEAETLKLQEDLRFYASQVVKAQEEERKRLSRELHDGTIQTLVVIADQLRALRRVSHDSLDDLCDMVDHTLSEIRSITWRLRPPFLDDKGLVPALRWLAGNVSREGGRSRGSSDVCQPMWSYRYSGLPRKPSVMSIGMPMLLVQKLRLNLLMIESSCLSVITAVDSKLRIR